MGNAVMIGGILVCLLALVALALAKPLRVLGKLCFSAALGSVVLLLGESLGLAVGLNGATVAVAAILGMPGVAGLLLLSFLL